MLGPIHGFAPRLIPKPAAPRLGQGPALSIEYIDLQTPKLKAILAQRGGSLDVVSKTAGGKIRNALEQHFAALEIPNLMEHTRERLDKQVRALKETLEARYGQDDNTEEQGQHLSPEDRGRRLVGFAISIFDSYLKRSEAMQPQIGATGERAAYALMIRGAVDKGFAEARSIYEGLEQLDSELAAQVQRTFDEVERRLKVFEAG
jgi:hypothetical protein